MLNKQKKFLFKYYEGEEYNMHGELINAVLELYKVNLGIKKNEKLLRAQGGKNLLMKNNFQSALFLL